MQTWVVAYDIRCDRNRGQVAKVLKKHGLPVQKSVFLVEASEKAVEKLISTLSGVVCGETDRIFAWPLRVGWNADQVCFPDSAAPLSDVYIIA